MVGQIRIESQDFPADFVRNCAGFALDIGGSAVKFVYRSKTDWENLQKNQDANTAKLHFLTCGRPDLDEALDILKQEMYITREEGKVTKVYSCGLGGYIWNQKLKDAFQVDIENVVEGDCLIEGIRYFLDVVPQAELAYPILNDEIERITIEMKKTLDVYAQVDKQSAHKVDYPKNLTLTSSPSVAELSTEKSMSKVLGDALYPILYLQLGSAYGAVAFNKEGPPKFLGMSKRGGRCFMGIASMLTGSKSYDEFIDLAEKGNHLTVNQTMKSQGKAADAADRDDDDPYVALEQSEDVIFYFGHTVFENRDKFKREDLAHAWLLTHLDDLTQWVHETCIMTGIQNILVGGSLTNRPIVRKHFIREITRQDCHSFMMHGKQFKPNVFFMKNGGHTGSLGAMINSINKFTMERKSEEEKGD